MASLCSRNWSEGRSTASWVLCVSVTSDVFPYSSAVFQPTLSSLFQVQSQSGWDTDLVVAPSNLTGRKRKVMSLAGFSIFKEEMALSSAVAVAFSLRESEISLSVSHSKTDTQSFFYTTGTKCCLVSAAGGQALVPYPSPPLPSPPYRVSSSFLPVPSRTFPPFLRHVSGHITCR